MSIDYEVDHDSIEQEQETEQYCEQCDSYVTTVAGDPACMVCRPDVYDDPTKELNFNE